MVWSRSWPSIRGAGHFPRDTRQQIDVHQRFVGWFLKHLGNGEKD